jgi:hypothetical protein
MASTSRLEGCSCSHPSACGGCRSIGPEERIIGRFRAGRTTPHARSLSRARRAGQSPTGRPGGGRTAIRSSGWMTRISHRPDGVRREYVIAERQLLSNPATVPTHCLEHDARWRRGSLVVHDEVDALRRRHPARACEVGQSGNVTESLPDDPGLLVGVAPSSGVGAGGRAGVHRRQEVPPTEDRGQTEDGGRRCSGQRQLRVMV